MTNTRTLLSTIAIAASLAAANASAADAFYTCIAKHRYTLNESSEIKLLTGLYGAEGTTPFLVNRTTGEITSKIEYLNVKPKAGSATRVLNKGNRDNPFVEIIDKGKFTDGTPSFEYLEITEFAVQAEKPFVYMADGMLTGTCL